MTCVSSPERSSGSTLENNSCDTIAVVAPASFAQRKNSCVKFMGFWGTTTALARKMP